MVLATLLVVHFVAAAGARPLVSPDEGRYVSIARDMLASGDWVTPRLNGLPFLDKPILFYWLTAAALAWLPDLQWAARLVPALMGALACGLVGWLAARIAGRAAGWLAAGALATMPLFYLASHFANMDLQVAFWTATTLGCAMLATLASEPRTQERLFLACWASAGAAVLTKGLLGVAVPALVVGAWLVASGRWALLARMRWVAGPLLLAAVVLPWGLAVQRANPAFFDYFVVFQHVERFAGGHFNNPEPWWFFPVVLAVALLPWSPFVAAAGLARAPRSRERDALLFAWIWAVMTIAFFSIPHSKPVGYILPAVPPLAILAGVGAARVAARADARALRDPLAYWGVLALTLAAAFAGWSERHDGHGRDAAQLHLLTLGMAWLLAVGAAVVLSLRARRRALAVGAIGALGCAVCWLLILGIPLSTADSQRRLGLALLRAADHDAAPVAYWRTFPYSAPLYARLRQPALLVEDWNDPRATRDDDWRLTLWRARAWQPGSAAALFRTPAALVREAAGRPRTWVVVESGGLDEVQRLVAAQPGLVARVAHRDQRYALVALESPPAR